ncbi:MAG: thioredoxin domain-containing protein [Hyphomicrobiaceae bacterium]
MNAVVAGAGATVALPSAAYFAPALAQASRDEIPLAELLAEGPIEELALGNSDAKVTVVEYASMTCGHCANFHNQVFPTLREKYIDTGKIHFILREYPLDNLAAAAAMLARCTDGTDKAFALTSALFKTHSSWVVRGNALPPLFEIAKQAGFTQESFNACLDNRELLEKIVQVRATAHEKFGVNATPTFFINGKRLRGNTSDVQTFIDVIEPLLQSS